MNRTVEITMVILIAALLLAGTSAVSAQAAAVQASCAPAGSNGVRPYWSYYQYPTAQMCATSTTAQAQPYWWHYQYPPRDNFFLAQQP